MVILAVLAGVALALAAFFRSAPGVALLATAEDPFAAELQGVPVERMRAMAWGAAGALGALAGVLGAGVFESLTPGLVTSTFMIPAFTGVVLGGITSMVGAVVGRLRAGHRQPGRHPDRHDATTSTSRAHRSWPCSWCCSPCCSCAPRACSGRRA